MLPPDPHLDYASPCGGSAGRPGSDAETRRWLEALSSTGALLDDALARLHEMLLRGAFAELHRRGGHGVTGRELDDLAHQAAADALVAITAKLGRFRGESRFTTWAYKFVILEVSTKLGRHFWQLPRAVVEGEDWEALPDRFGVDPEDHAERVELIDAVRQVVNEELTEHQRQVFVALVVNGVPLDALVVRLGSNRNAVYKTMFDARRKLRAALVANGHLDTRDTDRSEQGVGVVRRA